MVVTADPRRRSTSKQTSSTESGKTGSSRSRTELPLSAVNRPCASGNLTAGSNSDKANRAVPIRIRPVLFYDICLQAAYEPEDRSTPVLRHLKRSKRILDMPDKRLP